MTTKTGIIYLQKDKFQVYSPYLPNILEFRFVPEFIRDYDLVNEMLFENLLKVFLGNNKVPPSSIVIVISDGASFIKDFVSPPQPINPNPQQQTPPPTLEDLQNAANEYLEHVPFEDVASKVFPLATGVRAYATNQQIYNTLKKLLEKQGFIISSVLPGYVFGPNLSNRPTLDGVSVNEILQRLSTLQGYNLLKEAPAAAVVKSESTLAAIDEPEDREIPSSGDSSSSEKPDNRKMVLAVVISAIVIIVLITGIVVYLQFQEKPYSPPPSAPAQQTAAPTTAPAVQTGSVVAASQLTAQIIHPSAQASVSATLRTALTAFGFKSVVPVVQSSAGTSQNLLIFSPRVDPQIRSSVTQKVQEIIPNIIVQEKAEATFDITVSLGK